MPARSFEWRDFMSLYRGSRITIDHEARTIDFVNAIRTKSFFNILPIRSVTFSFAEIESVRTYAESGYRCVAIETATAKGVFLDADVPQFDDFADQMRMVAEEKSD